MTASESSYSYYTTQQILKGLLCQSQSKYVPLSLNTESIFACGMFTGEKVTSLYMHEYGVVCTDTIAISYLISIESEQQRSRFLQLERNQQRQTL